MAIIYKPLFEVKLYHEYYLTNKNGASIFSLNTPTARAAFLQTNYERGEPSINNDISFELPASLQSAYDSFNLKILPTYSGFKIVVRVNEKRLTDGTLVYTTAATLPGDLSIQILFVKRNGLTDSYTNARINRPVPGKYFFSNAKLIADKTAPFLTNPISAPTANYKYEQGELAFFGANDIRGFFSDSSGDNWNPYPALNYVNENDRLLVPLSFDYTFPLEYNVTDVQFTLSSAEGTVIKSAGFSQTEKIKKSRLDFSAEQGKLIAMDPVVSSPQLYLLEVSGNSGYTRKHYLTFSNIYYRNDVWAVACFNVRPAVTQFSILDSDGNLYMKKDSSNALISSAPVFEIPVKTRFAYWRYIHERGYKLKLVPDLQGYVVAEQGKLITLKPNAVTRSYYMLQKNVGTEKKYLPNPVNYQPGTDTTGRMFFDVRVPSSDLFQTE